MPQELLRVAGNLQWTGADIHPCPTGMETVLRFMSDGTPFSLTLDALPDHGFFLALPKVRCVSVFEFTRAERGWLESGRHQVLINDDHDCDTNWVSCDAVRWEFGST